MTMKNEKICNSCGVRLVGNGITFFKCPICGAEEIGRCAQCRDQSVKYECKKCGFTGP
jgi:Zn-ribbon RNA-binding protein